MKHNQYQRRKLIKAMGTPLCVRCGRLADDLHEIKTRARGGSISDPANTVPICRPCHRFITDNPAQGHAEGLLKHSWE